ncbi:hypothetical protein SOVF_133810, partial [Spinacia oleracea]
LCLGYIVKLCPLCILLLVFLVLSSTSCHLFSSDD